MSTSPIRVLVVDDSTLSREILSDIVNNEPGMTVVGQAASGEEAVLLADTLQPDAVTLDVQMPGMDGFATLDAILNVAPIPVIMVSSITQHAAEATWQALERGALDYVPKPESAKATQTTFAREIVYKLRLMASADVERILSIRKSRNARKTAATASRAVSYATPVADGGALDAYREMAVVIGISTGGPPALSRTFEALHGTFPPIVVVQHMLGKFTEAFAARLDRLSSLTIHHAATGMKLEPNHVYVAPGGKHLRLVQRGKTVCIDIQDGESVSGHKPSIDVAMQEAASIYGPRCLGIIMTGMGYDGVDGCGAIRHAGGYVLGQDAETSDVYGMNKGAFTAGHVDEQFALVDLPTLIPKKIGNLASAARNSIVTVTSPD